MTLVLGIDTGGTYTDGVLLDHETKEVVATSKTLTTHHDLTIGILEAIDTLSLDDPSTVKLVSISTTLATNAVAEGKGKPVALFLLGYDPELIRQFNFASRFATPHHFFVRGGHDLQGNPQAPLDEDGLKEFLKSVRGKVEAIALSGYFSPLNPAHEEQAASIIQNVAVDGNPAQHEWPVVLGHQLSTRLDSVKRATTASLNASLLPLLQDFVVSVSDAMEQRGLEAPLMVVRGDGTLMSAAVAEGRPVETVHSGPAASAVGGHFLARSETGQSVERALVIDIGGTTTDIAVVDGGRVQVTEEGATVGGFRTAVQAADIHSIGLGGDSHLTFDREDRLVIGPARVVPLANLAAQHPRVSQELRALRHKRLTENILNWTEYWFLMREPPSTRVDARAVEVLTVLRDEGPQAVKALLDRFGLMHPLQFGGQTLLEQGIIGRAGLTPTDLLHVSGEYAPWDVEAARVAAEKIGRLRGWDVDEFVERVKERIAERIVSEAVSFLTKRPIPPELPHPGGRVLGRWLLDNSLSDADPYLETPIRLRMPLIGIGAPAGIFLPRVAELLHTDLVLPDHYPVANAVGAVAASVVAQEEARIYPHLEDLRLVGYYAQWGEERRVFSKLEPALDYAKARAQQGALAAARESSAVDPQATVDVIPNGADSYRVLARAIGNPRLGNS